jgi:uncharacterized protein (DUF2249 family)
MRSSESNGPDIVTIDVSELEPPEPMEQILARLRQMQAGQLLRVRHRREPLPLYPLLEQAGYRYCCIAKEEESFLIYIWARSAPVDETLCRDDAAREA